MTTTRNRYLVRRGERWYYFRRIPKRYAHIDARTYSKAALNTDSLTVARERRDAMADADENLWDGLSQNWVTIQPLKSLKYVDTVLLNAVRRLLVFCLNLPKSWPQMLPWRTLLIA